MTTEPVHLFAEPRDDLLEAELAAAACLHGCLAAKALREPPTPIPAELWVESPLGYDFGFEQIQSNRPGFMTCGYAILGMKIIRIHQDLADDEAKVRWTTAHEVGHHVLHTRPTHQQAPVCSSDPGWRYRDIWERQADRFAAAFLMPPHLLVREFFAVCRLAEWDPENAIIDLLSDTPRATHMWTHTVIPHLARVFGVHDAGVIYRLCDLRLFDDGPLLLPKHAHRMGLLQRAL
ncbi:MAG: hypothetical protein GIKADHBN_01337 [Phycisphaerales bacterium]|nr:hypothetical protein [Phycisphaerales bacterium]